MLLEKLSLSPLQVFWWQRTVEFFNKLAASPVGSLFHLTLLDNLRDAFYHGVDIFCSSICWFLTCIGHLMSRDCSVASVHDVLSSLSCYGSIYKVPTLMRFIVPRQPLQLALWAVPNTTGLSLTARQGVIVSCLFLVGACNAFCNSDWPHMVCPLSLAAFLGDNMLTEHAGYVFIVEGCPLGTSCT